MEQGTIAMKPLEGGNQNNDLIVEQETTVVGNSTEALNKTESKYWQIGSNLNTCLRNVHVHSRWTDMTIRCGEASTNRPLKAHKMILASRSPVFEAMFFGTCNERIAEFDFPGADINIFDKMLRFMYTDDANLERVDEAKDLLQMAHMYQIMYLVDHCASFLQNNTTPSNVCKILDCALKYDITMLRDFCCEYIDNNAEAVITTDAFLNISKEGLTYILKGDTFYAPEDIIYHRIEQWAKIELSKSGKEETGQNIRDILGDAFYHLRLPTLPTVKMMECIKKKGYFSVDEYEDIIECNLSSLSKLDFMSNVRRVPVEQILVVSSYRENQEHSRTVQQTLQIKVDKSVQLKYIEIPLFKLFMNYSVYGSFGYGSLKQNKEQNLPTDIGLGLSVVANIDQIGLNKKFNVHQTSENSSTIVFDEPVLLKKRSSPFDLEITIEPNCRDDRVVLIGTSASTDLSYVSKDEESHVTISQAKQSFIVIKAIGIENYSFRENEEGSEESKLDLNSEEELESDSDETSP